MFNSIGSLIVVLSAATAVAGVSRVGVEELSAKKPTLVRVTPGRITVMDFPCELSHSLSGLHDDVHTQIGPDSKRTLSLWLTGNSSSPTNLAIRCEGVLYVLDIFPNQYNHQDYIKFKFPDEADEDLGKKVLIASSSGSVQAKKIKPYTGYKKLIDNSSRPRSKKKKPYRRLIMSSDGAAL